MLHSEWEAGAGGAMLDVGGTGLQWHSEYLRAGGVVTNRGIVVLTTNSSKGVRDADARFVNEGTVRYDGHGFHLWDGATFENRSLFDVQADGSVEPFGSGPHTFINTAEGTFRKSGGIGTTHVSVLFENAGRVDAQAGTLQLNTDSEHTDVTLAVAAGATLRFHGGTHTFSGTLTSEPEGSVVMASPWKAGTDGVMLDIRGTGLQWHSEYLRAGGVVTNRGMVVMTTNSSKGVRDAAARFVNEGTVRYDGQAFHLWDGATFENRSLFDVQADGSVERFGSGPHTFINTSEGTFQKSAGTGTSQVSALFENEGRVEAQAGTLQFTTDSEHTDATLAVASDAALRFQSGTHTFSGTLTSEPEGDLVLRSEWKAGTEGVMLDVGGTGLQWENEYLRAGGVVTNRGVVVMTTNSSKGVRDAAARFVNEGTVRYDGNGFRLWDGATFENRSLFDMKADGSLTSSGEDPNTFVNAAGGTFRKSAGDGVATVSTVFSNRAGALIDLQVGTTRFTGMLNHDDAATIQGLATLDAAAADFVNSGLLSPGASPGLLTYVGTYAPSAGTAALDVELGGLTPGTEHDRLAIEQTDYRVSVDGVLRFVGGDADLRGTLDVKLLDGFTPVDGDAFVILTAPEGIRGGFEARNGLVDVARGQVLYPQFNAGDVTLTARDGIPTLEPALAVDPGEVVGGERRAVTLTGAGFAPDVTIRLVCNGCDNPEAGAEVPVLTRSIAPDAIEVLFDLSDPTVLGSYDVVVTDPRGGEARTPILVTEPPPVLSVAVLDGEASEDGRDPGLFVIRSDRMLRVPVETSIRFSGSATPFADYMSNVIRNRVAIPAGRDSVVVSIFPLNDAETEETEWVTLQLLYEGEVGQSVASVSIADGPPANAFGVYFVSPDAAANVADVVMTIGGQGFTEGATARLTGGDGVLDPIETSINDAGTILTARFALAGQTIGSRTLEVRNGDGAGRSLADALTIESPVYPEVTVRVLAPPRVPRTRVRTYTLLLHNKGNVNVMGYPSLSGLPPGATWETDFTVQPSGIGSPIPFHVFKSPFVDASGMVITLPVIVLAAGETREIEIRAAIDSPQTLQLIGAWVYLR